MPLTESRPESVSDQIQRELKITGLHVESGPAPRGVYVELVQLLSDERRHVLAADTHLAHLAQKNAQLASQISLERFLSGLRHGANTTHAIANGIPLGAGTSLTLDGLQRLPQPAAVLETLSA